MSRVAVHGSAVARTAAACVLGAVVTALILLTPYVTFGFESASAHLVLNSVDACVGLLVAYLVHGRFLRQHRVQDLLVSQALTLLVIASLGLGYLAELRNDVEPGTLDVWLPLAARLVGAVLIAAAALAGPVRTVTSQRWHRWASLLTLGILAGLVAVLWVMAPSLPAALDPSLVPTSAQRPILTGHPVLLVAQSVAAVCFALAAVLFTVQAADRDNELLRWLGPACALGAFARLNYFLYPSLYTDWLYTGDLLRTGFYLLLLVGAMREIQQYWSDQAQLAVLEDRRRLARELHDGVIQELTYIRSETIRSAPEDPQIRSACDRALSEARAAVLALGTDNEEPLTAVVGRACAQLAEQYDVDIRLDLDPGVDAEPTQRHAVVRILREAVTNAVRHGGATHLRVGLTRSDAGRQLTVDDDGCGFDVGAANDSAASTTGGYGLVSMRDRARSLPGSLNIRSTRDTGTRIEVTW